MPSPLAETIIAACQRAQEMGAQIPKRNSFGIMPWGVDHVSPGEVYALNSKVCCPLGALLLESGSARGLGLHTDVRHLLGVKSDWIDGFLAAELSPKLRINMDSNAINYTSDFKDGWAVALEVLEWVNAQE